MDYGIVLMTNVPKKVCECLFLKLDEIWLSLRGKHCLEPRIESLLSSSKGAGKLLEVNSFGVSVEPGEDLGVTLFGEGPSSERDTENVCVSHRANRSVFFQELGFVHVGSKTYDD